MDDPIRTSLIAAVDASIDAFNQDGRMSRKRATRRARRVTGLDWTYSALLILQAMKDDSTLRMTQLADSVGTTPPTITKLVRDLEEKGLISRVPDEQDGRASLLRLTQSGLQAAEAIGHARLESLRQVLSDWSNEDLERFTALFERLRADMCRLS